MTGAPLTLGALEAGPLQFDEPVWLVLIPVLWALTVIIGRKSIAGLDRRSRWVALLVRLVVIALIAGALAEPHSREVSESVSVTFVVDESRSIPSTRRAGIDRYIEGAAQTQRRPDDRMGVVTAAEEAYVQALPSALVSQMTRQFGACWGWSGTRRRRTSR